MSLISLLRRKNEKMLFTTPSHGGCFFIYNKFRQFYKSDISETDIHNPQEALMNAQKKASVIYGTVATRFLTNGSTSGIIASVLACVNPADKVLVWENSHPCHKNAVKLAGGEIVEYALDTCPKFGVPMALSPQQLEKNLKGNNIKAVIVTSPSYEGFVCDIEKIAEVCRSNQVYLIVDEAHGALYPFCDELPKSAVKIADFTVQSLHKTAGGLNPTALVHCTNKNLVNELDNALSVINTTSPSYPMLATIEANINYLNSQKGKKRILTLVNEIRKLRLKVNNIDFGGDDITKILIKKDGLDGYKLSEILFEKYNIEDERTNSISTMLLCGLGTNRQKLNRLEQALLSISKNF